MIATPGSSPATTTTIATSIAPLPPLLSKQQVAELIGQSPRSVDRLDSAGRLPQPVRVGAAKRWRTKDLLAWIEEGCPRRAK